MNWRRGAFVHGCCGVYTSRACVWVCGGGVCVCVVVGFVCVCVRGAGKGGGGGKVPSMDAQGVYARGYVYSRESMHMGTPALSRLAHALALALAHNCPWPAPNIRASILLLRACRVV